MTLLQRYFWHQALSPLLISLSALATLAVLTQSLSTLDLIVDNRQSALTFFYVTLLALPQLVAIIMPLAVFIAILYAFNRMNMDSELVVAKASGFSPGQIASPAMRLASYAMIIHLLINLAVQPYAFRKMREALFSVRTDIAAQMIQSGQFVSPTPNLTIYAQEILPNGHMQDLIIYDARKEDAPLTYMAKKGYIHKSGETAQLILQNAAYQQLQPDKTLHLLEAEQDSIDLTDLLTLDTVFHLKASDRYLHELFRPDPHIYMTTKIKRELMAEGHARLSTPLYSLTLTLLALAFLIRGEYKRMGYGRYIVICAALGFCIRLVGFALTAASESNMLFNIMQYAWPLMLCLLCGVYLTVSRSSMQPRRKPSATQHRVMPT